MINLKNKLIWILSIALSAFFIYKGFTKHVLGKCKVFAPDTTIPSEYVNLMNSLCHSGFLKMIGVLQILCGLLLIFPRTRVIGALLLFPIIFNIFMLHFFADNRPEELVETGIPLIVNLVLIVFLYNRWKNLVYGQES
ncbi:MAG: DoxX family protein [Bacteroidota bacterium]